ncbi:CPBP family intramembrane glutamic endopeptidase [Anaeromyxobacter oryzisoli]|uniref:CPBP family intramembrane glutamic endopeptidase n=1 Tax=Anaeromyxobacter oryzisoli TaxID=2925408 RepID=UPI001F566460|nr:CPBP family intramembrane glutamic endopeptidase [Anaeromyxobacter sp. SG63]
MEPTSPAIPAPPGPPPAPAPPRKSATLFFLTLVLLFLPGLVAQSLSRAGGIAWSELFVFFLPPVIFAAGSNLRPVALLGLGRPRARELALAALVGVAAFLVANGVMALWSRLLPARVLRLFDVARVFDAPLGERIAIAVVASVLAPVCEETAFRGYLQRTIALRRSPAVAIAISALLFGVLHDPVRFPAVAVLGAVFGWLAWRSGSTWTAIMAHAVNNGLASGFVLAEGVPRGPEAEPPLRAVLFTLGFGALALSALMSAYRVATTPPPATAAVVLVDPGEPSTRFSPARVPDRLWAAAAIGIALLLAMLLAARLGRAS